MPSRESMATQLDSTIHTTKNGAIASLVEFEKKRRPRRACAIAMAILNLGKQMKKIGKKSGSRKLEKPQEL